MSVLEHIWYFISLIIVVVVAITMPEVHVQDFSPETLAKVPGLKNWATTSTISFLVMTISYLVLEYHKNKR